MSSRHATAHAAAQLTVRRRHRGSIPLHLPQQLLELKIEFKLLQDELCFAAMVA